MSTSYDLLKRWRSSWIAISAVVVFSLFVRTHAAVTGHLTVAWELSIDPEVIGYVVDYGGSPGGYTAQQDAGYATTLTLWDLEVGETYYLAVRGYTATGTFSDFSNEVFGEALDPDGTSVPPPAAPSGLTAAVNDGGDASTPAINLAWADNSYNEDRFVVERALNGASFQYLGQTAGPNIQTYTDRSVQPEKTHAYRVVAQSYEGGNSPPSNIASANTEGVPNAPPSANAGGPYSAMVGESITFDGSRSSDPDGDPLTYTWDFGNGQAGSGERPTHSYSSAASFSVILFATDGQGGSDSDTATATTVTAPNAPPSANAGGPYSAMVGQSIAFDASRSSDPDGDPLTHTWDFGDGQTGSGKRPTHAYSSAGSFYVTLLATDSKGASDSDTAIATLQAPSSSITLSASGYKVKGKHRATLTWSGATSATVDIYRDGGLIATVPNSPSTYTDVPNNRGRGSYEYQVCKAGSSTCSNIDTVKF